jgi:hypothetical protein
MSTTTKTRDQVSIVDKTAATDGEKKDLKSRAEALADILDLFPASSGEKVAGWLLAQANLGKGNHSDTANPVAYYLSQQWPLGYGALPEGITFRVSNKVWGVGGTNVIVESANFKAYIPLPKGVKAFLADFEAGYHAELYKDR